MLRINATHLAGITLTTNGGSFFNADANAEVSIYGGGQSDKDQPITLWGSNIVIKAQTALGSLGTITMTDASNVALSNITCGTIGAGTNAITCGLISANIGSNTAGEYSQFGSARVGNHYTDYASFQHVGAQTGEYAILQFNNARTFVGCAMDEYIQFTAGNNYIGRLGGDADDFRVDWGTEPQVSIPSTRILKQNGEGGTSFTNNYVKAVNLIAGTERMSASGGGSFCRVNECCFYALQLPLSTRTIMNTTFDWYYYDWY